MSLYLLGTTALPAPKAIALLGCFSYPLPGPRVTSLYRCALSTALPAPLPLVGTPATIGLRSPFSKDADFVFASEAGTPMMHSSVRRRGLAKGAANLNRAGKAKLTMHDLRHCFASMLIREGADVVFVSRQLGHSSPAITLGIYAHLFDSEAQATRMRDALQARFGGNTVVTSEGKGREDTGTVQAENVVSMRP